MSANNAANELIIIESSLNKYCCLVIYILATQSLCFWLKWIFHCIRCASYWMVFRKKSRTNYLLCVYLKTMYAVEKTQEKKQRQRQRIKYSTRKKLFAFWNARVRYLRLYLIYTWEHVLMMTKLCEIPKYLNRILEIKQTNISINKW